jgi:hypothetical protein
MVLTRQSIKSVITEAYNGRNKKAFGHHFFSKHLVGNDGPDA